MDGDVNSEFLFDLKKKGSKPVLDWCMNVGLIASVYKCHKCFRRMKLNERKGASDGYEWRCRTYGAFGHETNRSIRKGSWFNESKLSIIEILIVTYYWVNKLPYKFVIKDLRLNSETVVDWRNFCREVCMEICILESCVLGGEGVTVEIHHSKVGKRKMNKRKTEIGKWVVCGLERNKNKIFLRIVEKMNKDMLLDIIKTYILPGTSIVSDCWKSFNCTEDVEFMNFINNQSLLLIDPEKISTNKNEVTWGIVKQQLTRNYCSDRADSYLAEILWRRSQNNEETLETFLEALLKVYPPRHED